MDYMAQVPLTHARRPKCCLHSTRTIRPVSKVPRSTGRRGFCGGERCGVPRSVCAIDVTRNQLDVECGEV